MCSNIERSTAPRVCEVLRVSINLEGEVFDMPTYDYRCEKCKKRFSVVQSITEHGKKKMACPKCKSRKVVQLLAAFSAQTSRKS